MSEFSKQNVRNMVERAANTEEASPTLGNARALEGIYAWLDLARENGVDVDAVIKEVRG